MAKRQSTKGQTTIYKASAEDSVVSQFDMKDVEALGLVKFDLLTLLKTICLYSLEIPLQKNDLMHAIN
jgi:DNA polymerase III alpha subunit